MRHTSLYNPESYKDKRVAIIGVGTIGSHLALTLARMQVPLTLYDHDTIEEHNLATQSYTRKDIGKYKVQAVQEECLNIGAEPKNINVVTGKFILNNNHYDLVVSCVDSIDARRLIAQELMHPETGSAYSGVVIDGRVGAEQVEVYRFANAQEWLTALPDTADTDPCGARFTAYTANVCAGLLGNNVKRELLGQSVPARILYDAVSSTYIKT